MQTGPVGVRAPQAVERRLRVGDQQTGAALRGVQEAGQPHGAVVVAVRPARQAQPHDVARIALDERARLVVRQGRRIAREHDTGKQS